ncbi:MAG: hypothetical protein MRERV_3c091 [Mycoplasmataceae bacterium RV_VA103A]|nr:MAG: hypothetical protein MRERV_3c091 [Mycoplasmataceae bacterium RV_VA103A]
MSGKFEFDFNPEEEKDPLMTCGKCCKRKGTIFFDNTGDYWCDECAIEHRSYSCRQDNCKAKFPLKDYRNLLTDKYEVVRKKAERALEEHKQQHSFSKIETTFSKKACIKCGFLYDEEIMEQHQSGKWYCSSCFYEGRNELIQEFQNMSLSFTSSTTSNPPANQGNSDQELKQILLRVENKVNNLETKLSETQRILKAKTKTANKATQTEELEAKVEVGTSWFIPSK